MESLQKELEREPTMETIKEGKNAVQELESLFQRYDRLNQEKNLITEQLSDAKFEIEQMFNNHLGIAGDSIDKPQMTYAIPSMQKAFRVSRITRTSERVTKEGKSFIKIHATPELLENLIRTSETSYVEIREMFPRDFITRQVDA